MHEDAIMLLGELRGFLGAFAWLNHKTNHGYTFEINRMPEAATLAESVRLFLKEHNDLDAKVSLKKLRGWRTPVAVCLERWLFSFLCDVHDGRLLDPHRHFSISEKTCRKTIVTQAIDTIEQALHPSAAWKVDVDYSTRQFYECGWDDFAFESESGRYLLHVGVSD